MREPSERFVEKIVDDLKSFSANLLEAGLAAPGVVGQVALRASGMRSELGAVHSLSALVPSLLAELQAHEAPNRVVEQEALTPLRASLSRNDRSASLRAVMSSRLPS